MEHDFTILDLLPLKWMMAKQINETQTQDVRPHLKVDFQNGRYWIQTLLTDFKNTLFLRFYVKISSGILSINFQIFFIFSIARKF